MKISQIIEKYFWLFMLAALAGGLLYPIFNDSLMKGLGPMLMVMLFLVFLKLDIKAINTNARRFKFLGYLTIIYLLVVPAIIYLIFRQFDETLAIGLLLLTAMPAGTASPALTELLKGNTALATTIVIITSLLAPFSVPLLFKFLTATELTISYGEMFSNIALLIFLPLLLAQLVKVILPTIINKTKRVYGAISVLVLTVIIYATLGSQREVIIENPSRLLVQTLILFLVFIILHIVGYALGWKQPKEDKMATTITRAYMNNGLAIVLAVQFFSPAIVIMMVLSEIPWGTLLAPLRWVLQRTKKQDNDL